MVTQSNLDTLVETRVKRREELTAVNDNKVKDLFVVVSMATENTKRER